MLALVNGMDAVNYKRLEKLTACFGYPILLSNGMDPVKSLTLWMLALVNGMDAVSYKRFKNLTACFGYPIPLSNGMDAVKSPNPYGC